MASIANSTTSSTAKKQATRCLATTGMIGNLVEYIGGDRVRLQTLMGPGVDPHLYKPTRDDVVLVRQCEILFYSGLHLEGRMGRVFDTLPKSQAKVVIGEECLSASGDDGQSHHADPHVWMDVNMWSHAVIEIRDELSKHDEEHKDEFTSRSDELKINLDLLDKYGRFVIGTIPENQRILITSHDAFQYFGRRYGLRVEGLQGIATDSEAGLRRISTLIELIRDKSIPSIFVESSISPASMRALVQGCEAQGSIITLGGPLYSDSMGPSGTYEGTYIGMMDHNFTSVARLLGGSPPEGGMRNWHQQ